MNSELHSVFLFTRSDITRVLKRINEFRSESNVESDCSYMDEMSDLLRGVIHTIDDIITSAAVMWNALFLLHIIHSMNVHASNIEACHKAADVIGSPVFRLDIDHRRMQCHIQNILCICRYNLSRMCTSEASRSRRKRSLIDSSTLSAAPIGVLDRVGTYKLLPRIKSPTLSIARQDSTKLIEQDRVDPLLHMQLNKMNRLSRKFTSRNLMGLHDNVSDMLKTNPTPTVGIKAALKPSTSQRRIVLTRDRSGEVGAAGLKAPLIRSRSS